MIAPGDQVDIFISTPVWVTLKKVGSDALYFDRPSQFLSDTWFGPNNLVGELSYATRTQCRMYIDELPMRANRATTPIRIRNELDRPFTLERINVPIPYLRLLRTPDGRLWTDAVVMTCHNDKLNPSSVTVDTSPEGQPDAATVIAAARQQYARDSLKSMMAMIFSD